MRQVKKTLRIMIVERNAKNDPGPDAIKSSKVRECRKNHKGLHWERELIVQANFIICIGGKVEGLEEWSGGIYIRQANSFSLLYKWKKEQPCLMVAEDMLSPGKCI